MPCKHCGEPNTPELVAQSGMLSAVVHQAGGRVVLTKETISRINGAAHSMVFERAPDGGIAIVVKITADA